MALKTVNIQISLNKSISILPNTGKFYNLKITIYYELSLVS